MRWRLAIVLVGLLFVPGCLSALEAGSDLVLDERADAARDAGPDGASRNLWLLDSPAPYGTRVSGGAEPSILVDRNGQWIWIGDTSGLWRSGDGGATWMRSPNPFTQTCDGWALAQDDVGTLHVASTACTAIQYAQSRDGGASWSFTHPLVEASPVADRPWIAARGDGEVAILFYDFGRTNNESCVASNDGGTLWLSRSSWVNNYPNAGNAVFDAQGRLYYATGAAIYRYEQACDLMVDRRTTGGSGAQIFTQVALDEAGGMYVAQPSTDNARMEIRAFPSWSGIRKIVSVSSPDLRSNTFGAISAHGDEVAVAWYGSETPGNPSASTFNGVWNVYVTRIRDFWGETPTVLHDRLTTEPNHVGGFCMGGVGCGVTTAGDRDLLDYFGITHDSQGNVHVAYGHDGAGSSAEVRYAYLAR